MRCPILDDVVKSLKKGTQCSIPKERRYEGLAFIAENCKEEPGETEEKNKTIEKKKRSKGGFFIFFTCLIIPEDLKETDEGDEGKIGVEG